MSWILLSDHDVTQETHEDIADAVVAVRAALTGTAPRHLATVEVDPTHPLGIAKFRFTLAREPGVGVRVSQGDGYFGLQWPLGTPMWERS